MKLSKFCFLLTHICLLYIQSFTVYKNSYVSYCNLLYYFRILNDKKYKHILEELIEEEKTNLETAKILKAIKRSKQESSKVIDLCDKNVIDSEDSSSEDDFEEDLRRRGPPSKQSKPFPNLSSNMNKTRKTLRMKKKTGSKPKEIRVIKFC